MATRKVSVSLDVDVLDAVRSRVGEGGVSSYLSRAAQRQLERDGVADVLADLADQLGPPDETMVEEYLEAFRQIPPVATDDKRATG